METVRLGGLRSTMKKISPVSKDREQIEEEAKNKETPLELKSFDLETARLLFIEFSKTLIQEKRGGIASFFADPLIEVKGDVVIFTVGSKIVADGIKDLRQRAKVLFADKGYLLTDIECVVNAVEISQYKVFTPQQKFDVMTKKHPVLKDFADRFNLEIE